MRFIFDEPFCKIKNEKSNKSRNTGIYLTKCYPGGLGFREGVYMKRLIVILFISMLPQLGAAQCAMCRAVLESEGNASVAEGVNDGIVYLMAIPYILVGVLFYFVYKKLKQD